MTWSYNKQMKPDGAFKDFGKKDGDSMYDNKKDFGKKDGDFLPKACVKVSGGEITDCVNTPVDIEPLVTGAVVKVPAVLAELTVQFNVNSIIDLPEPATEIKSIGKRLKITQCLLLQNTNMLFIEGFVRKNIQYATRKCSNSEGTCGDIRHCSVDVPFKCSTAVTFNGLEPLPVIPGSTTGFEYLANFDIEGPQFGNKDHLQTADYTEFNQISTEYFNELPFCELISSRIVEFDEFLNPKFLAKEKFYGDKKEKICCDKKSDVPFEEIEFCSLQEKMVIFLTLKVLQNRQVAVPPLLADFC